MERRRQQHNRGVAQKSSLLDISKRVVAQQDRNRISRHIHFRLINAKCYIKPHAQQIIAGFFSDSAVQQIKNCQAVKDRNGLL